MLAFGGSVTARAFGAAERGIRERVDAVTIAVDGFVLAGFHAVSVQADLALGADMAAFAAVFRGCVEIGADLFVGAEGLIWPADVGACAVLAGLVCVAGDVAFSAVLDVCLQIEARFPAGRQAVGAV